MVSSLDFEYACTAVVNGAALYMAAPHWRSPSCNWLRFSQNGCAVLQDPSVKAAEMLRAAAFWGYTNLLRLLLLLITPTAFMAALEGLPEVFEMAYTVRCRLPRSCWCLMRTRRLVRRLLVWGSHHTALSGSPPLHCLTIIVLPLVAAPGV